MDYVQSRIFNCGVIPVIKLDDANDAVPLCEALYNGGLDVAEITFRTEAGEQAIKNVAKNLKNVFVGAGTILNVENAKRAIDAGSQFIISPGFNVKVVEYCLKNKVAVFPGTSCPTDIEKGIDYGLEVLKFFPAEANGGIKALKAMSAPYNMVKFMPTGGIDTNNLLEYLSFDKIIACGGTWMVKEDLIKSKNFDQITSIAKDAVSKMHNFKFIHTAINTETMDSALSLAQLFDSVLNIGSHVTSGGAFAGDCIEIMGIGSKAYGEKGHIGFKTTNLARAIAYFEKRGIEMDYDSIRGTKENPTFIYFKQLFGGFAVHLVQ